MRFFYTTLLILCSLFHASAQQNKIVCGTSDEHLPQALIDKMARLPAIMENQRARGAAGEMRICRIGVEIDYPTFVRFDRDTNLISRMVLEDIEKVSEVYEKEINTRVIVSSLRIWKDPNTDPFRIGDDIGLLLDVLNRLPASAAGIDKRMYLYTKPLSGGYGGLANIAGMSNVSPFGSPETIMHELGHNFGSPHTHNCSWPGGPIDACAVIEGDCYDRARENLGYKTGTIMSYCSSSPTFHPLCRALMRDHADLTLPIIGSAPEPPKPAGNSNFTDGDYLMWKPVINAMSYQVTYATRADLSGSKTVETRFPGIQFKKSGENSTYYARVRAVNRLGASAWSGQVTLQVQSVKLAAPEIVMQPGQETIAKAGTPYVLPYAAVPGASSYEIQIMSHTETQHVPPFDSLTFTSVGASYTAPFSAKWRWRVRAVNGQNKSKWSEQGFFSVNPDLGNQLSLPFSPGGGNAPTRFPFRYNTLGNRSLTRITVSSSNDFANPLFIKEYTPDWGVLGVVSGLPANAQLYFRLEEWNADGEYFPKRKIADVSFPFKTGGDLASGGLTFMSEVDPNVFNDGYARIAVAERSVWTTSRSHGYVRIDQESLGIKSYNAKTTNGLIGYTGLTNSLQADEAQKIHILSEEGLLKIRKVTPSERHSG